jgi:ketosteroid isomerase-like protein
VSGAASPPGDDGVGDLARLVAHDEIRMLASRYAVAVDARDLDALVDLFVDDVQVGRDTFGRDALRDSFQSSLSGIGVSILHVGTHQIDLLGPDDATGLVYCLGQVADGDRWVHQSILYRDTYARRDGRWRFVRRVHELWYGEAAPTNPLDQAPANWPEHAEGRGTVPESFPSWARFWAAAGGGADGLSGTGDGGDAAAGP